MGVTIFVVVVYLLCSMMFAEPTSALDPKSERARELLKQIL
jgi:ABC-type polar amino acid transport system ATPase subunit